MKEPRKEIASLVTRVEQGLSDSAKNLGDLALQKYREVHVGQGLATVLDRARQEIADKIKPRHKKAKARAKSATKAKPLRKNVTAQTKRAGKVKTGRKKAARRTKAKTASRSRSRTSSET
jgi:hypothetical protein